jgi:mannosyltransferase
MGESARNVLGHIPILSILALLTALAFYHLGAKSIWLDEAASVTFASKPWSGLLHFWWNAEPNMGLYYVALKLWTSLFGTSEAAVRSLSVLPAVGTVWATWRLGLKLFSAKTALLAALILSLNPYFLGFAQEARAYTMMTFLATLATLCFIQAVEHSSLRRWLLYAILIIIGMYVHLFMLLLPVAHLVSFLVIRKEVPWRHLVISATVGVILITPLLARFTRLDMEYSNWITPRGLRGVASLFYSFAAQNPGLLASYFLACCVAVLGVGREYYQYRNFRRLWPFALLALLLFLPIALVVVAENIKPLFVNKYLLFCLPPLTLVVALGLTRLRPPFLSMGLLALILALSVSSLPSYYRADKEEWRGVTQYLVTYASPADAVLFYAGYTRMGYDYYLARFATGPTPEVVFPIDGLHDPDGPPPDGLVDSLSSRYGNTWLVLSHDQFSHLGMDIISEDIQARLAAGYNAVEEHRFKRVRVVRYRR